MKRLSAVTIAVLLFGFAAFSTSHYASGQTGAGWVTLFDGKNLDNWDQIGDANWKTGSSRTALPLPTRATAF